MKGEIMVNLLKETEEELADIGKTFDDVIWIGKVEGGSLSVEEFKALANQEYDNGYGGVEVDEGLVILFSDNTWLERAEYDGSEWWEYKKAPIPFEGKAIKTLFGRGW